MKVAILKIGYVSFAFQKPADAAKVLDLLGRAVEVAPEWHERQQCWVHGTPGGSTESDVSMELIPADRLRKRPVRAQESRQLRFTPTIPSTLPHDH